MGAAGLIDMFVLDKFNTSIRKYPCELVTQFPIKRFLKYLHSILYEGNYTGNANDTENLFSS